MKCGNVFKQKKMKTSLEFKTVSVTISGDYYQILFHDGLDIEDEPYFLIQRQFEFPDGGVCNFESHHVHPFVSSRDVRWPVPRRDSLGTAGQIHPPRPGGPSVV